MIPDIENKINLRKKLVEEVTSEILVWSNKETFSFSINKLACFAASNIVDYIIFGKEIYNPYPKKKIIDSITLSSSKTLKKNSLFFSEKAWCGNNTRELRAVLKKKPWLITSGIKFNFDYQYKKFEHKKESENINYIITKISNIFDKYGIEVYLNEIPKSFIDYIVFIKYFLYKSIIKTETNFINSLRNIKEIYMSDPWQIESYILRKFFKSINLVPIWLPHGTAGYHFCTKDESLYHLVWVGMKDKFYSDKIYSLNFENLDFSSSNNKEQIQSKKAVNLISRKSKSIGIVIFPLGDLNSYPHYQSNSFIQIEIIKKLIPFYSALNENFNLYFLCHPSTTNKYKFWLKQTISNNLNGNYFFGTYDKFSNRLKNIVFTYIGTSTFHESLIAKKNIFFLSLGISNLFEKFNIVLDNKYFFTEISLPFSCTSSQIKDYLIEEIM